MKNIKNNVKNISKTQKRTKKSENNKANYSPTILSKWKNEISAFTAIGSLIVTVTLVIITYSSLEEVKRQRDLTYKQFVMANRPNVNIGFEGSGLRFTKDIIYIDWLIANDGGSVKDLMYQSILFHMQSVSKTDYSIHEFYVRNMRQKNLNRGTRKSIHNEIKNKKTIKEIERILSLDKRTNIIGLYLRVEYNIPAELTIDGIQRKDSLFQIFAWDVIDKRFEDMRMSYYDEIVEKISTKQFNLLKDQG